MMPQVAALEVLAKANENIDGNALTSSQASNAQPIPFDPAIEDRGTDLIKLIVAQLRETIQNAGRFPISVTLGAVPPKAVRHILNMVAFQMVSAKPNLQMVIINEKGVYSPIQTLYKEGLDYMKSVENGAVTLMPSDPTGIDYINPVDPDSNPAITGIFSAPMNTFLDLSTTGPESGHMCRGTTSPNGSQQGEQGDTYEQINANGQVIKIWEKISSFGNMGWI